MLVQKRIRPPATTRRDSRNQSVGRLLQPCLPCRSASAKHRLNTDRWYYRVFQSAPDLIRALLPNSSGSTSSVCLEPEDPGDRHYRFDAPELKELNHRLDGVLWSRESTGCAETGSPEFPVVLLEVQMHRDTGFHHRLAAQTYRFLQSNTQRWCTGRCW